jgi:D-amino peptidase
MKILIAADMEGISGVTSWNQVNPAHPEYTRFRKIMTGDVNAAIRGAAAAGTEDIVVSDGHNSGRNILIEELDPRARLNSGTPSPLSMVQGIGEDVNGVLFLGYHARIGTSYAILEHTWSDERVANFWMKGENDPDFKPYGEIGLNAAVCGHFGVPVLMISGDQAACNEACQLVTNIETAVVKWPSSRMAAECLPPEIAQHKIQETAHKAVSRLTNTRQTELIPKPLIVKPPITMAIDFVQSEMADKAAVLPGVIRQDRRVEYIADDIVTIYRAFRAAIALAK